MEINSTYNARLDHKCKTSEEGEIGKKGSDLHLDRW